MTTIYSFKPIAPTDAKVLILGSMPSELSLQLNQYYAHPRNSFWLIMGKLLGAEPSLSYSQRTQVLLSKQVALWDVLKACQRQGSLDAKIKASSMIVNDFVSFYAKHPQIKQVFFNGSTSEKVYKKQVLATVNSVFPRLQYTRLPSTSPAHAVLSVEQKLAHWQVIKLALEHQRKSL